MEEGELILVVVLVVVLLALVFVFAAQISSISAEGEELLSPTTEEPEEVLESRYDSLVISPDDLPEIIMYKLFRYFDPVFLNETDGTRILFNPFILDLKANEYDDTVGILIGNLTEGIRNFSAFDNDYQIGTDAQQPPDCGSVERTNIINYNNDCWDSSFNSNLCLAPDPCAIYVCGLWGDGCGGTVNCGGCTPPDVCIQGTCGPGPCTPVNPCATRNCGLWGNGCGGTVNCGAIGPGEICDSGILRPCKIFVNGDGSNKFNDKIKIRIRWYKDGTSSGREIFYNVVTICDG